MSTINRRLVRPMQYPFASDLSQLRRWFTDNPTPPAGADDKPKTPAPAGDSNGAGVSGSQDPEKFDRKYVEDLRKEAADYRTKNRDLLSELEPLRAERDQKKQAAEKDLKEQNKYKDLYEQREAELNAERQKFQQERLGLLKGNIAARFTARLPKSDNAEMDPVAEFAKRLQGNTEEEIKADAERLIALFGVKPAETPPANPSPTNTQQQARRQTTAVAPGGQPAGETDSERRSRLYKQGSQHSPLFKKDTG